MKVAPRAASDAPTVNGHFGVEGGYVCDVTMARP